MEAGTANAVFNLLSRNYSTTFNVVTDTSQYTLNLKSTLRLNEDFKYEMALVYFTTFNNISNVTSKNNTFSFVESLKPIALTTMIVFPEGTYEIKDIEKHINQSTHKVKLTPDTITGKCKMVTSVDVINGDDSILRLLGFTKPKYIKGEYLSENIVDIIDIDSINICCDLIYGGFSSNGDRNNVIYSFPSFTVPAGYRIIQFPNNLIYFQTNKKVIDSISFKIVDQKNEIISFNNQRIVMNFHLKQIK